jgi:phosphohistidine swiveling domain-containing protein
MDPVVLQCVGPDHGERRAAVPRTVTAREMRLPAIKSVRGAMALFQDGQTVTVDGTQGLVHVA